MTDLSVVWWSNGRAVPCSHSPEAKYGAQKETNAVPVQLSHCVHNRYNDCTHFLTQFPPFHYLRISVFDSLFVLPSFFPLFPTSTFCSVLSFHFSSHNLPYIYLSHLSLSSFTFTFFCRTLFMFVTFASLFSSYSLLIFRFLFYSFSVISLSFLHFSLSLFLFSLFSFRLFSFLFLLLYLLFYHPFYSLLLSYFVVYFKTLSRLVDYWHLPVGTEEKHAKYQPL